MNSTLNSDINYINHGLLPSLLLRQARGRRSKGTAPQRVPDHHDGHILHEPTGLRFIVPLRPLLRHLDEVSFLQTPLITAIHCIYSDIESWMATWRTISAARTTSSAAASRAAPAGRATARTSACVWRRSAALGPACPHPART